MLPKPINSVLYRCTSRFVQVVVCNLTSNDNILIQAQQRPRVRAHQSSLTLGLRCARIEILSALVRLTDNDLNKSNARGILLIGRKDMHYAQLKFTCVLNRTLFSYADYLQKHADIFKTFFIRRKSLPCCILHWWITFLISLTQNNIMI